MRFAYVAAVAAMMAFPAACGGNKKKEMNRQPVPKTCKKLLARHQECLDALAVMARQQTPGLLARSMEGLTQQEREQLSGRIQAALSRNQAEFGKLLARSIREKFPSWCAATSRSKHGKALVGRLAACLSQPDCQTYAACLGKELGGLQPSALVRSAPGPVSRPAADAGAPRANGDASAGAGSARAAGTPAAGTPAARTPTAGTPAARAPASRAPAPRPGHARPGAPVTKE